MFGLKIKILLFHSQNRAQYPIYDETMQSRSLLEGKTNELKQFLKSIIFNPKNENKNIAFLFVLSIFLSNCLITNDSYKIISISLAVFNEQVSEPPSLAVSVASPMSVQSAYNFSGLRTNGLPTRHLQHSRVECAVKNFQ